MQSRAPHFRRRGSINKPLAALLASILVMAAMVAALTLPGASRARPKSLLVYCAAGLKGPIEEIRQSYEQEYNVRIELQYGGSQTLLSSLEVTRQGDLFISADEQHIQTARTRQLVNEAIPVARQQPVLAVRKGNPLNIDSLDTLLASEAKIALANSDMTAIGALVRQQLEKSGQWKALEERTAVFKSTVNEVANDLKVGAADAGIVWDQTVIQYGEALEQIDLSQLAGVSSTVVIGRLASSSDSAAALHFARYVAARDQGQADFVRYGFSEIEGDAWADRPQLTLFAGTMLQPAIEQTVTAFEQREGVQVTRVYNGCGILVAQMKADREGTALPDAYFACDSEFMQQVSDLFPEPVNVSQNQLVILVKKGNPHGIASLKDLSKPGLRVGIGHEKQCAMGWLTQKTLTEGGVRTEVMENVVVETPSGDMLVNQMRAGSLDAAVAYLSNAVNSGEYLDAIKIKNLPCANAVQPLAVGRHSRYPRLSARLMDALLSVDAQQRFLANGFDTPAGERAP